MLGFAGAFAGTQAVFQYNRDNFLFDRKLRQEQEIRILEFRNRQAELWREDVRQIMEMTAKKMDSYTIVAALLLDLVVGLFAEGRLEPGAPAWLLSFYMMSLGGAFMYLFMSVWFAMQASVIANCSSVRLLTQFVRLPVPNCEQLEDMRTYASSFESLHLHDIMRIPWTGTAASVEPIEPEVDKAACSRQTTASSTAVAGHRTATPTKRGVVDPWSLELDGHLRGLIELEDTHPTLRPHIALARRAALQYQCFDAFSRVALSFGVNQFLNGILYYCIGYLVIQNGSVWPAWCMVAIILAAISALVPLEFGPSMKQRIVAQVLIVTGPSCCAGFTSIWLYDKDRTEDVLSIMLHIAFASHALWLLWALAACGVRRQASGAILPTRFQTVLYLDIFGWMKGEPHQQKNWYQRDHTSSPALNVQCRDRGEATHANETPDGALPPTCDLLNLKEEVCNDLTLWQSEIVQRPMDEDEEARVADLMRRAQGALHEVTKEIGPEMQSRVHADLSSVSIEGNRLQLRSSYTAEAATIMNALPPAIKRKHEQLPSRSNNGEHIEASAQNTSGSLRQTMMSKVHFFGDLLGTSYTYSPLWTDSDGYGTEELHHCKPSSSAVPTTPSVRPAPRGAFLPASYHHCPRAVHGASSTGRRGEIASDLDPGRLPAKVFHLSTAMLILLWISGSVATRILLGDPMDDNPSQQDKQDTTGFKNMQPDESDIFFPMFLQESPKELPALQIGELIHVDWPDHSGFFPRALSTDTSGTQLVVADDLGLYSAHLLHAGIHPQSTARQLRALHSEIPTLTAHFERVSSCLGLEGQGLHDMTVSCADASSCRVFVLLDTENHLVECSLGSNRTEPTSAHRMTDVKNNHTWTISSSWLEVGDPAERVESVGINSKCLNTDDPQDLGAGAGCVVVGTSCGRIVQLRGHQYRNRELVPKRTIYRQERAVGHGSLHTLASGFVLALSKKPHGPSGSQATVVAFDSNNGSMTGEWRLPSDLDWLTVSAGDSGLFALGLRDGEKMQLYRFPRPCELEQHH